MKLPCVYIMTNRPDGTLYVGVTSNLPARVWHHQHSVVKGFTQKYNLHRLVWFEPHDSMSSAISREKQLKAGSRSRKVQLIVQTNPSWRDLSGELG